ncbi:hypothetical protein F5X68DRAFT_217458 [Plectosphaerella plurivora]|uniref:Uncharacterized protein n=1 Tax=Plectosphaerella plurivora TaxID=936078 RepID=A0A9P8V205_9PEZI|nr:hypothetical protein F5X68DRAFT_217458 [Plectosphaerella plurivora]
MYLSSPNAERALSRRGSDGSYSRADIQLRPLTKTPPQYRDVSPPPMRNGHERKASVMQSTEVSFDGDAESHTGSLMASDAKTRQAEAAEESMEPPRKKQTPPRRVRSINIQDLFERSRSRSRPSPDLSNGHHRPAPARHDDEEDQDLIMMPPPRPRGRKSSILQTSVRSAGTAETTSNDHIRARTLPKSWAQESVGEASTSISRLPSTRPRPPSTRPQPQPTSPASTILTQASGVKKRKRIWNPEGRLKKGMSSSAPQPKKKL